MTAQGEEKCCLPWGHGGRFCPGSRSGGWMWKARAGPPPRRGMRALGQVSGDGPEEFFPQGATFPKCFLFPVSCSFQE